MKRTVMHKTWERCPAYAPLVEACAAHGISRSVAYQLMNAGKIDTFKLGAKRYVMMESLRTLPERLR